MWGGGANLKILRQKAEEFPLIHWGDEFRFFFILRDYQKYMVISELRELSNKYRLNKTEFEKDAKIVRAYYHEWLDSVATQKAADRAWISFDTYLNKRNLTFLNKMKGSLFRGIALHFIIRSWE